MKRTSKNLTRLWAAAMLMLSLAVSTGCAFRAKEKMVVVPSDRTIKALPSGNYEVTPLWLKERYEYERWLKEELDRCRGKGG